MRWPERPDLSPRALGGLCPIDVIANNGDDSAMRYPGGKGKCFQQIINLLPPHRTYIESHLGGGAVMRHKVPAKHSIGIDIDARVISTWRAKYPGLCQLVHGDACDFLRSFRFCGEELVYCDPPYVSSTRKRPRVYRHDYTVEQHEELLAILQRLPCLIVVSGYTSPLYEAELRNWNRIDFSAKTHRGVRMESLWFNFEKPIRLHDSRYVGSSFREREIVKRRQERLRTRIARLHPIEQHALLEWMLSATSTGVQVE